MAANKLTFGFKCGLLAALVVVGAAALYIAFGTGSSEAAKGETLSVTTKKNQPTPNGKKPAKKIQRKVDGKRVAVVERHRPNFNFDSAEEAKMTEQMRAIYRELQEALDSNNRKKVFALVHKLQAMDEWPDGIPASVKKRALDALAWFGAPGLAEAVGFLADSSQEIKDAAVETFKQQLADSWDLGDKKLGEVLVSMSKIVTDADALDTFYDQLDNMRPSVRAQTVSDIYKTGSENAQKVMDEKLESVFATDDVEVKDRSEVDKALQTALETEKDPDVTKDYDEQYGPQDWDW